MSPLGPASCWSRSSSLYTVLTQPAPLVEKATEAAVSAQPTPPTEKAAGEAAPPTEKWVTSSCGLSGCVHTNHLTGTTTAHDWQGGKVTSNKWTGQVTASNHQGTHTTNLHTGNWHATGCSALGCGTHGGNKYSGHYYATPHYLRKIVRPSRRDFPFYLPAACVTYLPHRRTRPASWSQPTPASSPQPVPPAHTVEPRLHAPPAVPAALCTVIGAFAAIFLAFGLLRRSRASKPDAATAEAPAMQLV